MQVKFVVPVIYQGQRIPAHTPFTAADEDEAALRADGAIVTVAPAPKPVEPPKTDEDKKDDGKSAEKIELETELKKIYAMTVPELKEYAELKEIDISGATLKEDIRAAIEDAISLN
jgi:hypothetical protein